MARALRYDVANSLHHVTNRGLERRNIVRNDLDRREFVELLDRVAIRHRWRVFAWVLLDNHFHLFFRIPTPSLSDGMHDLESGYAAKFNRRHQRQGPLFQDRFHDVVVESESHSWELSRYVHLNPCRARLAVRPEEWRWSSYRHYLDPSNAPGWLDWPTVLAERGLREAAARIAYKRFVESGLAGSILNPFQQATDGWILGNEAFVKRVQTACQPCVTDDRLQTPEDMIAMVARVFSTTCTVIQGRGRHENLAREAAIMLCREQVDLPAAQLATFFGVTASGFSMILRRAYERTASDSQFAALVQTVRKQLGQ